MLDGQRLSDAQLRPLLWPAAEPTAVKTWAILDAARDAAIFGAVEVSFQRKACLFAGDLDPVLKMAAPYLVQVDPEDRLTSILLQKGWGRAWGVFVRSDASLETLRRHFRKFLRVTDYQGRRLLFRYYDPRVLPVFLPTCLPDQLEIIFGPVASYWMEMDAGAGVQEFKFVDGKLLSRRVI